MLTQDTPTPVTINYGAPWASTTPDLSPSRLGIPIGTIELPDTPISTLLWIPPLTFARQHKRTRFPLRASAITQILKAAGITPPYSQAPRSPAPEIDRAHATHLLKLALGRRANLIGRLDPDQFEDILLYIIRGKTPKHVAATIRAMFPQSPPKRRPNK